MPAGPVGLGAILSRFDREGNEIIVAYASRTLTQVERRYPQTEKEALAVMYIYIIYITGQVQGI
jgi:hypothetical protein